MPEIGSVVNWSAELEKLERLTSLAEEISEYIEDNDNMHALIHGNQQRIDELTAEYSALVNS